MAPRWYTDSDVDEALRRVEAATKGTDDEIACKVLRAEIDRYGEFWAAVKAASDLPWYDQRDAATEDALDEFAPDTAVITTRQPEKS